jgi:hypothetical protein
MTRCLVLFAAALLVAGSAHAQVQLPSAPDETPKASHVSKSAAKEKKETRGASVDSVIDKTLKLNGVDGALVLSKGQKDQALSIQKLTLSGEVISTPTQKCEISIVADGALEAESQGSPDGVPRYAADIPACPFSFDVVKDGVIVPPQTRACVFQAADCQASPSGVWGPEPASLGDQAKAIAKDRSRAEASIADSLKALGKQNKGASAELDKDQSDFNSMRDETCRNYEGEAAHGFCDARLTDARAALLRKQAAKAKKAKKDE